MKNPTLQAPQNVIKIRTVTNRKEEVQHGCEFSYDDHVKAFWDFKHQILYLENSEWFLVALLWDCLQLSGLHGMSQKRSPNSGLNWDVLGSFTLIVMA